MKDRSPTNFRKLESWKHDGEGLDGSVRVGRWVQRGRFGPVGYILVDLRREALLAVGQDAFDDGSVRSIALLVEEGE